MEFKLKGADIRHYGLLREMFQFVSASETIPRSYLDIPSTWTYLYATFVNILNDNLIDLSVNQVVCDVKERCCLVRMYIV